MDAKLSKLLKMEATGLFVTVKALMAADRWPYFVHARETLFPTNVITTISPFRASMHFTYLFSGVQHNPKTGLCSEKLTLSSEVYLEREVSERQWKLSFSGLEGKSESLLMADALKPLAAQGFYIPNGNENLERQMNFSLGLYGDCLMHVDILFPSDMPPLAAFQMVLDHLEQISDLQVPDLVEFAQRSASSSESDDDDDLVIMGDWQTWK